VCKKLNLQQIKIKMAVPKIKKYLRLQKEETNEDTYLEIMEGAKFAGHNFWIMSFAMVIACVGLNTDSISAVIGAMLISPLMGPIVAFAFGLAINDNKLKKVSIKNWLLMTGISLLSATIFFIVSPFDNNTVALFSFTKATIFDILLAFFGGLAGFIGIIKKEGTKVIAGVAVATACMPPLCTVAFGIAHLDWAFTLGGLYFYLINCLFIGVATFLFARFCNFQKTNYALSLKKTSTWLWSLFILAMLAPGVYLGYVKYKEAKVAEKQLTDKERIKILEEKIQQLEKQITPK
jgi:uncharacterized hydrophobic protein (TIGR00271 family)